MNRWIKAARLRTLPLSLSGIILASFLAVSHEHFNVLILIFALFTTIGFQIISNFANDYGDGVKGTDNENRIGPQRALQSGEIKPQEMRNAIKISIGITLIFALVLIYVSFGSENFIYSLFFFILGIASIISAIKYTVGKNAYGYSGFGDLFVFIFFGLVSVCGTYFLYSKNIQISIFLPAFSVGLLSVGVLNLNNMRDAESDLLAGKKTLVVKIGMEFAKYYHYYLIIAAFLFALMYCVLNYHSGLQFIFVLAFIPMFLHLLRVYNNEDPKTLDPELKKLALSTFLFAVLFGLGQII